jgi:hypothetical protein
VLRSWKEVSWIDPLHISLDCDIIFLSSRHSGLTDVDSVNDVITFPSNKCFGLVDIGQRNAGMENSSRQKEEA